MDVVAAYSTAISAKRQADALDRIAKALEPQNIDGGSPITVPEHTIRVVDMKPGEAFFAAEIAKRFAAEIAKRALDDFAAGWIRRGNSAWHMIDRLGFLTLIETRLVTGEVQPSRPVGELMAWRSMVPSGPKVLLPNIEAWRPL